MKRAFPLAMLLLASSALAQQSPAFKLEEHVFVAGAIPLDGTVLSSASHRMTLGVIGDPLPGGGASSASFALGTGFTAAYPPPGEVANLRFTNAATLVWDAERSVGVYNLYQGLVTRPFDPNDGVCLAPGLPTATTGVPGVPAVGQAYFFLVTAENRLAEEGTKGFRSSGAPRNQSVPCP